MNARIVKLFSFVIKPSSFRREESPATVSILYKTGARTGAIRSTYA